MEYELLNSFEVTTWEEIQAEPPPKQDQFNWMIKVALSYYLQSTKSLYDRNYSVGARIGLIVKNIKWIMLIAGLSTCSMIIAVIAPQNMLMGLFGVTLTEPLANIVVRSWGFLIGLMGLLLIYGAFRSEVRSLCIVIVGLSKIGFILLVLLYGAQYLDVAKLTLIFDGIVVGILGLYLLASYKQRAGDPSF